MFGVSRRWKRALLMLVLFACAHFALAQESERKAIVRVEPAYPPIARRMHIAGTVKIEVTLSASGAVLQKKLVGGNPILASSCLDALGKWKFESGKSDDKQVLEFHFVEHQ